MESCYTITVAVGCVMDGVSGTREASLTLAGAGRESSRCPCALLIDPSVLSNVAVAVVQPTLLAAIARDIETPTFSPIVRQSTALEIKNEPIVINQAAEILLATGPSAGTRAVIRPKLRQRQGADRCSSSGGFA